MFKEDFIQENISLEKKISKKFPLPPRSKTGDYYSDVTQEMFKNPMIWENKSAKIKSFTISGGRIKTLKDLIILLRKRLNLDIKRWSPEDLKKARTLMSNYLNGVHLTSPLDDWTLISLNEKMIKARKPKFKDNPNRNSEGNRILTQGVTFYNIIYVQCSPLKIKKGDFGSLQELILTLLKKLLTHIQPQNLDNVSKNELRVYCYHFNQFLFKSFFWLENKRYPQLKKFIFHNIFFFNHYLVFRLLCVQIT